MADNNYRSYRSRDPLARDEVNPTAREGAGDPLAELARLIGQTDPNAEGGRHEAYSQGQSGDNTAAPGVDWAADDSYAERHNPAQDRYVAPPPPLPPPLADSYPSYAAQERGYENESAASGQYFSGPAAKFTGFREEAGDYPTADDARYRDVQQPVSPGRQLPAFTSTAPEDGYADEQEHDGGQAYGADDYYDDAPNPRRRGGLVVVMAVLGLAVVGTAGAFAYRAMFGGSVLPTLPPIIRASNGPNKIVPSYGDAQASNPSQAGVASAGSTENLVSREEQPVNMEPPKAAPRVVSTIPILPGQSSAAPVAPAPIAGSPTTPSPGGAPPPSTAAPLPPAAPAPVSSEPKKIHTVVIRADQSGGPDAAPVPPTPKPATTARSAARPASPAPKPSAMASAPPAGPNAPLSIVPGAQGDASAPPPARTRTAAAPMSVASAAPVTAIAANPSASAGGGYAVQVTSQRSEADAQASFRSLQAKYPNQLGGRGPIIRRADLGDKGVHYRAFVGPFASKEEAARMCSSLKAAGGDCNVQKN